MKITPNEAYQITLYQIGSLYGFVKTAGGKLNHVKPHGALYNMAAADTLLAKAIAQAVFDFDSTLILYALAGSEMIKAAENLGLASASEVFADRTYQPNGQLTPRSEQNAIITDERLAIEQVLSMVQNQYVIATNNQKVDLKAETLCLHGDGLHAVDFAKTISEKLKSEGITIRAPRK